VAGLRDSPLAAFVELRLRLGLRRLRGRGGVPELVARILSYAVLLPAGLLFAGLMAAGTHHAARAGRGLQVDLPVSSMFFGIWQAWTAVAMSLQEREGIDLRRFLLYPLPASRLFAYGVVASVIGDPFSLFWCVLLGGAFAGAAVGRFGAWLLLLAVVLVLFAAATACYVVLLQEAMGRLLRGKRTRELLIAVLYVGLAFGGVALAGGRRSLDLRGLQAVGVWLQWLAWPAALAAGAARALFSGRLLASLPWLAGLALATAAAGWGGYRLTLRSARSGDDGNAARGAQGGRGWPTGALPGRIGPLLEREAKHLLRHPLPGVLLFVIPALAGFAAWKAPPHLLAALSAWRPAAGAGVETVDVVRALPLLGFALYTHLATQVFWLNAFGWDRGGARLLFLAPLDLSEVMVAKNGAAYALSAALYLASSGLAVVLAGAPPAWALVGGLALHAGAAPWLYGLGNLVSVLNPRVASMTLQRSGNLPALSGLAGMAIVSGVAGLFSLPVLLALHLDEGWVLPAAWGALGVIGLVAYRLALPLVGRLVGRRREPLLAAVTGDDA
jgi:ABC-2 type transport system permease protein